MLEIQLADGSGYLDLYPSETIEFSNPLNIHDFEHIEGSKSWRFKLPKTGSNMRLTGWANLAFVQQKFEHKIRINVSLNGALWKTGFLYFLEEQSQYWDVHFAGEVGLLKELIQDKDLRDFTLETITGISNMQTHAKATVDHGNSVYNYIFCEMFAPNGGVPHTRRINKSTYSAGGSWLGFDDMEGGYYIPMVPFPYVKSVLQLIADELQIKFAGDLWKDEEFARLVFVNTFCLNEADEDGLPVGAPGDTIDLRNHVPKVPLSELIKEISILFNQLVIYDDVSSTITFYHRLSILNGKPNLGLRNKVSDIRQQYSERRTYSLSYEYNPNDEDRINSNSKIGVDMSGINNGPDSEKVVSTFSTIPSHYFNDYFHLPMTTLELNAEAPKAFLFYRGFNSVYNDDPVDPFYFKQPVLTCDLNYVPDTGYTLDSYSLLWKGDGGLYSVWWESFLQKMSLARVLKLQVLLSAADLVEFDTKQVYVLANFTGIFENLNARIKGNRLIVEGQYLKF